MRLAKPGANEFFRVQRTNKSPHTCIKHKQPEIAAVGGNEGALTVRIAVA